jgi:hypothetical protein
MTLQFYWYKIKSVLADTLYMVLSSTRPSKLDILAHKQRYTKTCKTSSLHILVERPDDGIRLMPKYVTFWITTNKVIPWMGF